METLKIIIIVFLLSNLSFAQIDTTIWYPLHVGDKWEYYGKDVGYSQVEVIGDTLMPNGKKYFILTLYDRKYQRVDDLKNVMIYNEYATDSEYVQYDLKAEKGNIFIPNGEHTFGYGVYDVDENENNLLGRKLECKYYREVYIDSSVVPPDTIWRETVDTYWPQITKGFGVTSYAYGLETLIGVIINGKSYGSLVRVKNEKINNNFYLNQNYPNPFNPTTKITYSLPVASDVTLRIYDILGREIKTLVDEQQNAGIHSLTFNATDLSSGTYFYKLTAGSFVDTKKLILVK